MGKIWVTVNTENRVRNAADSPLPDGFPDPVEMPEGWSWERPFDWVLADGALVHSPEESE